jgi:hypothetical protein
MVVLALGVALLAGWGLDCLKERRPWRWDWCKWAAAFAVGFALQAVLADPAVVTWAAQQTAHAFSPAILAIHAPKLAGMALLMVLALVFGPRRPQATTAVVLLVLCADLALNGSWVNPTAPVELFSTHIPMVDALGGASADYRVEAETVAPTLSYPIRDGWGLDALDALENRLSFSMGAALEGVRDARDTSPNRLYTPEYYRFWMQVLTWRGRRDYRPLADYNIRYVITQAGDAVPPGVRKVTEVSTLTRSLAVWEIEGWRPRAEMEGGTARIVAETPTRVALQVESGKGGTLVLRDRYHRGWKAWVDGVSTEVRPAQTLFRAVTVPAGGHTVEFAYRPWTFFAGAAISLAAVLGWILAAVWGRPRRPAPTQL